VGKSKCCQQRNGGCGKNGGEEKRDLRSVRQKKKREGDPGTVETRFRVSGAVGGTIRTAAYFWQGINQRHRAQKSRRGWDLQKRFVGKKTKNARRGDDRHKLEEKKKKKKHYHRGGS